MNKDCILKDMDEFINANRERLIQHIKELVDIKSTAGAAVDGMPFGPGPGKALEKALEIAKDLGLETFCGDGYVGWASIPGNNILPYIATVTHLDVVPEGIGWNTDPYNMQEKEGWLLGRGVCDDKGPAVLCLYAAKYLMERNIPLRYGLRILMGCNEETGMADIPHYLERHKAPVFCFSPDAGFPVCNGEKGQYQAELASREEMKHILEFTGGVALNSVADQAACLYDGSIRRTEKEGVRVIDENGMTRICAVGTGGHAAQPEGTENAIGKVVDYLVENADLSQAEMKYLFFLQRLFENPDGSGLGLARNDGRFDPLTLIGGTIRMEGKHLIQTVDCRYPSNIDAEEISRKLKSASNESVRLKILECRKPFFISPDHPAVVSLKAAYEEVVKETASCYTMGGGTYARCFPLAVSFGPESRRQEQPSFVGEIHGANEGMETSQLFEALKIYIRAVILLQMVDFEEKM